MEIIDPLAIDYSERFTSPEDSLLKEISRFAQSHPQANMLSGHVQGRFLSLISCLIQPNRILEIGTFLGYSALCLAEGLTPLGRLHTIELRQEDADTAQANFNRTNAAEKIILHRGNALDIIPALEETWDLVFIDADKTGYIDYYDLVMLRVRKGGLVIADNVLFHGEVLSAEIKGKNALAIQAFNEKVRRDKSADKVMLTVRDGLFLVRKR